MREQRGVTLTGLVIYMAIFSIILGIMATVANYFYKNVREVRDIPKYIDEYNQFAMFFVKDVKNNSDVKSINATSVTFEDGTNYQFKGGAIYRNNTKIASHIKALKFTKKTHSVGEFTKILINVDISIKDDAEDFKQNVDFVLKYW